MGVDAAAGILDHIDFEAGLAGIERGPCAAEIGCEAPSRP
jgi:hypothetical protein